MTMLKTLLASALLAASTRVALADGGRKSDVDVYNFGPVAPVATPRQAVDPALHGLRATFPTMTANPRLQWLAPVPERRPDSARPGSDR